MLVVGIIWLASVSTSYLAGFAGVFYGLSTKLEGGDYQMLRLTTIIYFGWGIGNIIFSKYARNMIL